MRALGRFVAIGCMAASAIATAQPPAADAAAKVLAQTREALGGEARLAAIKTLVAAGRSRQVRGDNLVPIEFEIAIELPDKYVRKDEIPAQESDPTTVGFNGDELVQFPVPTIPAMAARAGGPPAPTTAQLEAAHKARLANVRQDFARLTLGLFGASFSSYPLTFTYVGKAEAPQGKADVLDARGPAGFAARLFVNAETHLPIMISWMAPVGPQRGMPPGMMRGGPPSTSGPPPASAGQPPSPAGSSPASAGQGPPPESRIYYGDYRTVNGMQFPFRLRRAVGADTVEETTFDGFKINTKIDPKKFEVRK
jgi:hypothetical protein